jgi:lysophospholipase L1-like esterase
MNNKSISRRHFLITAGFAGIASSAAPTMVFANNKAESVEVPDKMKGSVFLFQGDSITDGNWGRQLWDQNHILGHGYVFAVSSRIGADFSQAGFTFHNRGVSGNKLSDMEKRWDTDTLALKPDVLSVLIGINDTAAAVRQNPEACDAEIYEEKYRSLLNQAKAANPNLLFVLGTPFVYPIGEPKKNWELWSGETKCRAEVVRRLSKEFDTVLVDYAKVFERATRLAPIEYWIWDGVHPTVFGHELMSREWIKKVSSRLNFLKKYKY